MSVTIPATFATLDENARHCISLQVACHAAAVLRAGADPHGIAVYRAPFGGWVRVTATPATIAQAVRDLSHPAVVENADWYSGCAGWRELLANVPAEREAA